ncbi:hypothetical protein Pan258_18280 [Symmachiella dynata]|uniref:DUF4365 domain-containing protein n=1 Tax=Symmachiella dynata TaxID=2527995 RepID=UPI001188508E|nr:DUF4365 domain-containing protein [Symmachiella dynata]QDT47791.1 hypothetical protein Pan258_18280 [Symmachiella dynata]
MKWPKNQQTATEGVNYVRQIVNDHGSIFHPIHQENDIGIDGYIELFQSEQSTGSVIAVQVKSGDSYLSGIGKTFKVSVDQDHLDYWCSYPIPVVIICYSPSNRIAAWTSITEYVRREKYHERTPVTQILVPFHSQFDVKSLGKKLVHLAKAANQRLVLINYVDNCLIGDSLHKLKGLSILGAHPDSKNLATTAFLARKLLFDSNSAVSDEAIYILSYHVARYRWSFNPNNSHEQTTSQYASNLCDDFTREECQSLIERTVDEAFHGPQAIGERVFDLLACSDRGQRVLEEVASNQDCPMERRISALYMLYGCDDSELLDYRELATDPALGDVYREMYGDQTNYDQ